MGKKRKKSTGRTSKAKTSAKAFDIDLVVILLIILGILSFLVIYSKAGAAGEVLSPILGGMLRSYKIFNSIWNNWSCNSSS